MSAYDGDLISAEMSWMHYTIQLKFESVGALAVTVFECKRENLAALSDPKPFLEHVVIDFSSHAANQIMNKSKKLRTAATSRGWQHQG